MHAFNFPINMNGDCMKNFNLPPGALQVWVVVLYTDSCGCTAHHKHTVWLKSGSATEDSGGRGHERAVRTSHFLCGLMRWWLLMTSSGITSHSAVTGVASHCFVMCCLLVPDSRHSAFVPLWSFEAVPRGSLLKEKRGCVKT